MLQKRKQLKNIATQNVIKAKCYRITTFCIECQISYQREMI